VSGYVLSADAELDLDEIWEYIAADSLDAADRWIGKLFDAFETLGKHREWATGARISRPIRSCSGRSALTSSSTAPGASPLRSWL
jgi:plasmid stabilization system protein ParE